MGEVTYGSGVRCGLGPRGKIWVSRERGISSRREEKRDPVLLQAFSRSQVGTIEPNVYDPYIPYEVRRRSSPHPFLWSNLPFPPVFRYPSHDGFPLVKTFIGHLLDFVVRHTGLLTTQPRSCSLFYRQLGISFGDLRPTSPS